MSKVSVKQLLAPSNQDLVRVLIDSANPSNTFMGRTITDILEWPFCDVMELAVKDTIEVLKTVLQKHAKAKGKLKPISEKQMISGPAREFVSLIRHLQNEFQKVGMLMKQLEKDPDADLQNAGIDKMDKYGIVGIYYSIDPNPLKWDEISEVSFGKMYTKLSIDKDMADIKTAHSKIIHEKNNRKK